MEGTVHLMQPHDFERRLDHVFENALTRRRLLRNGAAGALSASALAYLAACGETGGASDGEVKTVPKGEIASSMYFANWPLYIDSEGERRPTLQRFRERYGTRVKYVEEINDNTEFFGKLRPQLENGNSGGRDLVNLTDWMAARLKRLGYVYKLDKSELPNVVKNLEQPARADFDPNRDFSVPWQYFQTGMIYRKDKVKREPRSINDVFDPDYKGRVTFLNDMRDTVGLVMLAMGNDPAQDGVDQAMAAIDKIEQAASSGQVRTFTGNEYTKDLVNGNSWLIFGWSGDAVQLSADDPNIVFVQPDEGFMVNADSMQIPIGAPNPFTAQKFIDFVYQPEIQAAITEYVNFMPPVKGVREIIEQRNPELAESPLVFPDEETRGRSRIFRALKAEEEQQLNDAFQAVVGA